MPTWEVLRLGLDSLRAAGARTVLTILGVAVATAALVAMVAGGKGLQDNFHARMLDSGFLLNIAVFPDSGTEGSAATAASRKLDDRGLAKIRAVPGVVRVSRDIRLPVELRSGGRTAEGVSVGLLREALGELGGGELLAGEWFRTEQAGELVVTAAIARALGFAKPAEAVGRRVRLRLGGQFYARMVARTAPFGMFAGSPRVARDFRIAGVTPRERMGFGSMGAAILLPYGQAAGIQEELLRRIPLASRLGTSYSATVRVAAAREVERVDAQLGRMGYATFSAASFLKRARPVILLVEGLVGIIGSIGLVIACLGIANTMITEVFERTREIGILKAVGAEDRDVLWLFLGQAALYGLLGGVLGILLALGLSAAVTFAADWYFHAAGADAQQLFAFPAWLIAGTLAISVLTAAGAALYPALRAARLDPARALRHD